MARIRSDAAQADAADQAGNAATDLVATDGAVASGADQVAGSTGTDQVASGTGADQATQVDLMAGDAVVAPQSDDLVVDAPAIPEHRPYDETPPSYPRGGTFINEV